MGSRTTLVVGLAAGILLATGEVGTVGTVPPAGVPGVTPLPVLIPHETTTRVPVAPVVPEPSEAGFAATFKGFDDDEFAGRGRFDNPFRAPASAP